MCRTSTKEQSELVRGLQGLRSCDAVQCRSSKSYSEACRAEQRMLQLNWELLHATAGTPYPPNLQNP